MKYAIMVEQDTCDDPFYGRSVPIAKEFTAHGFTFYIVKHTQHYYKCIEATTGACIGGMSQKTVKEAYADAIKRLDWKHDLIAAALARWIAEHGLACDAPIQATYL